MPGPRPLHQRRRAAAWWQLRGPGYPSAREHPPVISPLPGQAGIRGVQRAAAHLTLLHERSVPGGCWLAAGGSPRILSPQATHHQELVFGKNNNNNKLSRRGVYIETWTQRRMMLWFSSLKKANGFANIWKNDWYCQHFLERKCRKTANVIFFSPSDLNINLQGHKLLLTLALYIFNTSKTGFGILDLSLSGFL